MKLIYIEFASQTFYEAVFCEENWTTWNKP